MESVGCETTSSFVFLSHLFYTRPHMLFQCICMHRFPISTQCLSLCGSSDGEIVWRKLATTGDVIWILMCSLLLSSSFFFFFLSLSPFCIIVWHTHIRTRKPLRAYIHINGRHNEDKRTRSMCFRSDIYCVLPTVYKDLDKDKVQIFLRWVYI
jgi:hypothetical protein